MGFHCMGMESGNEDLSPGAMAVEDAVWLDAGRFGCRCLPLTGALSPQLGASLTLAVVSIPEGKLFHVPNCGLATLVTGMKHHYVF